MVENDPDVIHVDNSSDLALSTSLNDLEIAALHIDGQSIDVDAPPDIIDVVDEDDDIIDEEDPIPHDLADSDDEDLVNLDIDDGATEVRAPESPIWAIDEAEDEWSQHNAKKLIDTSEKGLLRPIPKDFPYFHVEFGLKKGFVHVIDDESQWKSCFGVNVIRGMLGLPVEDMHLRHRHESVDTQKQAELGEEFDEFFISEFNSNANGTAESSDSGQDDIDPDNMGYEELLDLTESVGVENVGLSALHISQLPTSIYRSGMLSNNNEENCVICQETFKFGKRMITLPCSHQYHSKCIIKWLKLKKNCPICQKEVL
nr:E3 ubiquitin ligase BIG BROTHER-related-like [Tanacetum cinerariifolium]